MKEEPPSINPPARSWTERIAHVLGGSEPRDRDELKQLLRDAQSRQLLDFEALSIIEGAMSVSDMQAKEVMIPRNQMTIIEAHSSPKEFIAEVIESAHSRFPVIGDSPDEVLGILLAKDLLPLAVEGKLDRLRINDYLRPAIKIPESKRLNILLKEFRDTHNHMAIVVNEYGGIAGLVTIEDVLEQIVGEIDDEHDREDEDYLIKEGEDKSYFVKARTPVEDFNSYFNTAFSDDTFDTIGGFVLQAFGRLPERDESVHINEMIFRVVNADNRSIHLLEVQSDTG